MDVLGSNYMRLRRLAAHKTKAVLTKSVSPSNCCASAGRSPRARLCASSDATVFFLGLLTPRPRFRGLPSREGQPKAWKNILYLIEHNHVEDIFLSGRTSYLPICDFTGPLYPLNRNSALLCGRNR